MISSTGERVAAVAGVAEDHLVAKVGAHRLAVEAKVEAHHLGLEAKAEVQADPPSPYP